MLARVEKLPRPEPDVGRLLDVLRHRTPGRVPLLELRIDDEIQAAMLDEPIVPWAEARSAAERRLTARRQVALFHRLGHDALRVAVNIPFIADRPIAEDTAELTRGRRAWQNEHTGPIQTLSDFERYRWPRQADADYGQIEAVIRELPDGMGCIGHLPGVFDWATWMMGLEPFMIALREQPELIGLLADRIGQIIQDALVPLTQMERVVAIWVCDDFGFRNGTLISPADLRRYFLPWHRRYVQRTHEARRPFLLHACGNNTRIMADLVDDVGIDAKHSFEDVIQPVEEFHRQWYNKIAVIGGMDVDLLARGTRDQVQGRMGTILEACSTRGGYIAGSGNSITNYVPVDNYLTLVEKVQEFNGRR